MCLGFFIVGCGIYDPVSGDQPLGAGVYFRFSLSSMAGSVSLSDYLLSIYCMSDTALSSVDQTSFPRHLWWGQGPRQVNDNCKELQSFSEGC